MTKVNLPWPPSILSPNSRSHWAPKSEARKKYRGQCYALARQYRPEFTPDKLINLRITFCQPNKRHRDLDNMLASIKAALDAVAEAWGVNDRRFRLTLEIGPIVKHGAVVVEVMPA
jgi:crossover junction endodeoxyribonuclease RusA